MSPVLCYGAPLGRDDDWVIDAVSQPPEVVWSFQRHEVDVTITDLRTSGVEPTLDQAGFAKLTVATAVDQQDLADGAAPALAAYQRETVAMLQRLTGAEAVVCFDATLRREDPLTPAADPVRPAHLRVHVDQNPRSARARAANHGHGDRPYRRFQIVNVWRPLLAPVRNFPLALCDFRSVDVLADLVPTRLRFPPWLRDRENFSVKFNSDHRWYHWSALATDEVIVFKCHDSASRDLARIDEGADRCGLLDVAGLCPHTAFFDQSGPTTGRLRTSLELRALLFHD